MRGGQEKQNWGQQTISERTFFSNEICFFGGLAWGLRIVNDGWPFCVLWHLQFFKLFWSCAPEKIDLVHVACSQKCSWHASVISLCSFYVRKLISHWFWGLMAIFLSHLDNTWPATKLMCTNTNSSGRAYLCACTVISKRKINYWVCELCTALASIGSTCASN